MCWPILSWLLDAPGTSGYDMHQMRVQLPSRVRNLIDVLSAFIHTLHQVFIHGVEQHLHAFRCVHCFGAPITQLAAVQGVSVC